MTRAERRRAERERKKRAREDRGLQLVRATCPFCGVSFKTIQELLDHQDRTGHVLRY